MTRALIAFAGLIAGTALGFALLMLGYVIYAEATGGGGDFGLGFGLVLAPLGGLAIGVAMAAWLAFGRVRRPGWVIIGSLLAAIAAYVLATTL